MLSSSRTRGPFHLRKPRHGKYSTPIIKVAWVQTETASLEWRFWRRRRKKKKTTADNANSQPDYPIFLKKKKITLNKNLIKCKWKVTAMLAPYKFPCSTIVVITEVKTRFSSLHFRDVSQNTPHNMKTIITDVPQICILQDWVGVLAAREWWKLHHGKMRQSALSSLSNTYLIECQWLGTFGS